MLFKVNQIKLSPTEGYSAQLVLRKYRNSCFTDHSSSCLKFMIFFFFLLLFFLFGEADATEKCWLWSEVPS